MAVPVLPNLDPNFAKSDCTIVVSDLHLCEAEPVRKDYPLWKKYKTKEFFFDQEFADFLKEAIKLAAGKKIELVLNGDVFDFDSVTKLPVDPPYRISWLERRRGLHPTEEKSLFKMQVIIEEHPIWFKALADFIKKGHKVIFIVGNHDLELHWRDVQKEIVRALGGENATKNKLRFCEWFYISNGDTLIEHGNQYDPYCVCEDPVNPYLRRRRYLEIRIPFGDLTTRYLLNGVGYINPHVEAHFTMGFRKFVAFFFKYIYKAQPFLLATWFWGSVVCFVQSFIDQLQPSSGDPLSVERRIEDMAYRANTSARVMREMRQLIETPAASSPLSLARELYLDRATLILLGLFVFYFIFSQMSFWFGISIWWVLVPIALFSPFVFFYAQTVSSSAIEYKEPSEKLLNLTGLIAGVQRVVYGHSHVIRHETLGAIEHLNPGTWSPAFLDIECTQRVGDRALVWIEATPEDPKNRRSSVYKFENAKIITG